MSIDKASKSQSDYIIGEIPELKGYTIWLLTVEQKKVSADSVAFHGDYVSFYPATKNKVKAQAISTIGWKECQTESFSSAFDTEGAVATQCIVGATVQGGDEIAGVINAKFNSPYDYYDGKPIALVK